ncbi:hypothetical protein OG455_38585 [Kitasatospora sp. NBC_01287]|uniref:hypothetical protein n=1 Tax=Kitasatospora sp. NBC_01287 TaxID=2903573 RepID=UPI00224EE6D1|nr:hypothetical protein [Kitasatospora sp. NBC_01287]MCX4751344.1 hypothetical protein [Kitasatospora sp. NBC_01287]
MTPDRRSPGLPVFSESAADPAAPAVPAQGGERRPQPVEQGADFRQPPGTEEEVPGPARGPLGGGGLTFSDPDRQI